MTKPPPNVNVLMESMEKNSVTSRFFRLTALIFVSKSLTSFGEDGRRSAFSAFSPFPFLSILSLAFPCVKCYYFIRAISFLI